MRLAHRQFTAQTIAKVIALFALVGLAGLVAIKLLEQKGSRHPSAPTQAQDNGLAFNFMGAGSCSSTACHGGISPRSGTRINQNEYSKWITESKHASAYKVLLEERSLRIARNLKMPEKPDKSAKCLDCHALNVAASRQAQTFVNEHGIEDGVSCESCHGPAEKWLGPHTTKGWTHEQSLKVGMYDTRNPIRRAEKCLSCHLGNEEKTVDHEMIAAGHPDLIFELDTYSSVKTMPVHWKQDEDNWKGPEPKPASFGPRAWGVGQAVALREEMKQLIRRVRGPKWPEFAEFDCYACHHDLRLPSWRQQRGYTGTVGRPLWNPSRYAVFRLLVSQISPDDRKSLDESIARLNYLLDKPTADHEQIIATANQVAALADNLAHKLSATKFTPPLTRTLLRSISSDGESISKAGVRAAEQAAMSLDMLYVAYSREEKVPNDQAIKAAIVKLSDYLDKPERYNPSQFGGLMRNVHGYFR